MHPIVLLGDVGQVEARFGPFRDSVNLDDRCTGCAECTTTWKSFWAHPLVLLGDVGQVEVRFGLFRHSVNIATRSARFAAMYHRMEIILGTPDGTPR
jgi:hypothetical protein